MEWRVLEVPVLERERANDGNKDALMARSFFLFLGKGGERGGSIGLFCKI